MRCKYCKKVKLDSEFEVANTVNGKIYRRLKCKRCKQDTQNERIATTRTWLIAFKKTLKCERCNNADYRVLDFHHTKNKDNNVASMLSLSKETILKEIKKCIVLCSNCHRILHYTQFNGE